MIKVTRTYDKHDRVDTATAKCHCGKTLNMLNRDCFDTIECSSCRRLYNSSGQELNPRSQWEENMEDDY